MFQIISNTERAGFELIPVFHPEHRKMPLQSWIWKTAAGLRMSAPKCSFAPITSGKSTPLSGLHSSLQQWRVKILLL